MSDARWNDPRQYSGRIAMTNGRACTKNATGLITIRAAA